MVLPCVEHRLKRFRGVIFLRTISRQFSRYSTKSVSIPDIAEYTADKNCQREADGHDGYGANAVDCVFGYMMHSDLVPSLLQMTVLTHEPGYARPVTVVLFGTVVWNEYKATVVRGKKGTPARPTGTSRTNGNRLSREFTEFSNRRSDEDGEERGFAFSRILWMDVSSRESISFGATRRMCASTSGSWYSSIKTGNFSECGISQFFMPPPRKFRSSSSVCGGLGLNLHPIDRDFSQLRVAASHGQSKL